MSNNELKPHPQLCPNCKADEVMYERFALTNGEYVCDNCGWGMDAVSGEMTSSGESEIESEDTIDP